MSDLIDRQQAIDALGEYFERIGKLKRRGLNKGEKAISLDTVGAIKSLPPAQPKRGRWERGFDGNHAVCSNCQAWWIPFGEGYKTDYHFCPNCGADMRGEQDG